MLPIRPQGDEMTVKTVWGTAGTGKTTYLQKKFVSIWVATPKNIGMVTFRRNTANDFKEDMSILLNVESKDLSNYINTMHGMCLRNLGMLDHDIVGNSSIKKFNKQYGYKFKLTTEGETANIGMLDCYSWLKNNMLPLEDVKKYKNLRSLKMSPSKIIKQLHDYELYKHENSLIDFTDMLTLTLENGIVPDIETLFVDEFQDFTPLQFNIFKMWCESIPNVTIAGDPLQSIYGFWGAKPDYFNSFNDNKTILPKSYRLPSKIWETATAILKKVRLEYPDIETNGTDGEISHISYKKYTKHNKLGGTKDKSVYHLVRSRYQAPAVAGLLANESILFDGLHGWNDKLINVFNVILKIRAGVPLDKMDVIHLFDSYPLKYFNVSSKQDFEYEIKTMSDAQVADTISGIVKTSLYKLVKTDTPLGKNKKSIRQSMLNNILSTRTDPIKISDIKTTIETIHGSKGGERDIIFLHTAITPKIKKAMRRNPKEEARVWFTGVTRACEELIIVKDAGDNYKIPKVV